MTRLIQTRMVEGLDTALAGITPGSLIGYTQYAPGSTASFTRISATYGDVDSGTPANLTVSFTVPASGNVGVRLSAFASTDVNLHTILWAVRDASTVKAETIIQDGHTTWMMRSTPLLKVTGLTPGASESWVWQYRTTNTAVTARIQFRSTFPGSMEVFALP